jgi:cytochrome c oxidase subunit 4
MQEPASVRSVAHPTVGLYVVIYVLLLAFLGVTVAVAEFDLGWANLPMALTIATAKAVLIMLYFMQVRFSSPLTWLVAGAGFYWLAILIGGTAHDYLTRGL